VKKTSVRIKGRKKMTAASNSDTALGLHNRAEPLEVLPYQIANSCLGHVYRLKQLLWVDKTKVK